LSRKGHDNQDEQQVSTWKFTSAVQVVLDHEHEYPSARALALVQSRRVATLEWVDWFNHRRLLEPIGNMPPAEAEERNYVCATCK
jgi:transposase InsO family protein